MKAYRMSRSRKTVQPGVGLGAIGYAVALAIAAIVAVLMLGGNP